MHRAALSDSLTHPSTSVVPVFRPTVILTSVTALPQPLRRPASTATSSQVVLSIVVVREYDESRFPRLEA